MRTIKRDLDIINEIIDDKESDKPIYAEQYHYDHYEDYMEIFTDYICEQDLVDDSSFMKKLEKSFPKIFDEVMTELK